VMKKESKNRLHGVEAAAVGGSLTGVGANINYRAERTLRESGKKGLWDATKARELGSHHAKFVGSKFGARGLQVTGIPLALVGAKHAVTGEDTRRLDIHHDVVKPVARNAVMADQLKRGEKTLSKSDVPEYEDKILNSKRRAKNFSRVAGTLGLAALGTRAPEIANYAVKKTPKLAANKHISTLISHEPKATKASNALGIGSIGVGSLGAFNNAHMQNLEVKQGKQRRASSSIIKRDDKFLATHRDRISPKAEEGYKYLKHGANSRTFDAAAAGALGTGAIAYSVRDLRHKNKAGAALGTLAGAITLKEAHDNARAARAWNAKANKIKAKAYEREAVGEWGKGRHVAVAKSLWDVEKASLALVPSVPKGLMRKPAIRAGHLMRTRSGKVVSVNGSIG